MSKEIKILQDREHVILRPGMYIGSVKVEKQMIWSLNKDNNIIRKEVEYIPGLLKIFIEVLDNAVDEVCVRGNGDRINITIHDDGFYTIEDNGSGIPIGIHKEAKIPTPQVVFTNLRSSSNFNELDGSERNTVGMNGVGATLATIFSEKLCVMIKRDKKLYKQVYSNNMEKISEPKIEENDKQRSTGTLVKFKPDQKIFIKELDVDLIKKRCLDLSVLYPKVEFNLIIEGKNKQELTFKNTKFEDFVKMFGGQYSIYEDNKEKIKMAILHNKISDGFEQYSNINGADTFRGGTHIDALKELFSEDIKEKIRKESKVEVTNQDVLKNIILVNFQIWESPQFDGQCKEKLVNDKNDIKKVYDEIFSARRITSMVSDLPELKQSIIDDATLKNEKKNLAELRKTQKTLDKKKIAKLIEASSRNRKDCSIYITEGDSAISNIAMVRDPKTMAGLPLRGKVLNVFEESAKDVLENKEIQSIMAAIGLKIGESPLTMHGSAVVGNDLNYGKIIIATDQDMDGYCIRCLLINFFFKFWPEIIQHGFVYILETPLYEVIEKKNDEIHYFYNKQEYEEFMSGKHTSNSSKYDISYFKGLGSCGKDAWDYMINKKPNLIQVSVDNMKESQEKLKMAFGLDTEVRKEWLSQ